MLRILYLAVSSLAFLCAGCALIPREQLTPDTNAYLVGKLVDRDGNPLKFAELRLLIHERPAVTGVGANEAVIGTISGHDGTFIFALPRQWDDWRIPIPASLPYEVWTIEVGLWTLWVENKGRWVCIAEGPSGIADPGTIRPFGPEHEEEDEIEIFALPSRDYVYAVRIVDYETMEPVSGATVRLGLASCGPIPWLQGEVSDKNGDVTFWEREYVDVMVLDVHAEGYARERRVAYHYDNEDVRSGWRSEVIVVPGKRVEGLISDERGEPVRNAWIALSHALEGDRLWDEHFGNTYYLDVDNAGKVECVVPIAGACEAFYGAPGYRVGRVRLDSEEAKVTLILKKK